MNDDIFDLEMDATTGANMPTIQELWNTIQSTYNQSNLEKIVDRECLYDLADGISRMRDDKSMLLDEFCAVMEAHPEYLAHFLSLKGDNIRCDGWSFLSHRDVRRRYMDLIKSSSIWQPLYDAGAFELMELLVVGDARGGDYTLDSLSETDKEFAIRLSKSMKLISAGSFLMGLLESRQGGFDQPQHKVTFTRDVLVGQYQVTQALWQSVMGSNPSHFTGPGCPVDSVSWFDAIRFCNALSEQDGFTPVYTIEGIEGTEVICNWGGDGYRLLTEAEWEYCARGNQDFMFAGSNIMSHVAWFDHHWDSEVWGPTGDEPHVVGQKEPNGFGLYDMSGNVAEWVWDWFGQYRPEEQVDPRGAEKGEYRIRRGGCANDAPFAITVSFRARCNPAEANRWTGFRIARSV